MPSPAPRTYQILILGYSICTTGDAEELSSKDPWQGQVQDSSVFPLLDMGLLASVVLVQHPECRWCSSKNGPKSESRPIFALLVDANAHHGAETGPQVLILRIGDPTRPALGDPGAFDGMEDTTSALTVMPCSSLVMDSQPDDSSRHGDVLPRRSIEGRALSDSS